MGIWIGLVVAGLIAAGIVLNRLLPASSRTGRDLGEVSQNWLTEHKAGKRGDQF